MPLWLCSASPRAGAPGFIGPLAPDSLSSPPGCNVPSEVSRRHLPCGGSGTVPAAGARLSRGNQPSCPRLVMSLLPRLLGEVPEGRGTSQATSPPNPAAAATRSPQGKRRRASSLWSVPDAVAEGGLPGSYSPDTLLSAACPDTCKSVLSWAQNQQFRAPSPTMSKSSQNPRKCKSRAKSRSNQVMIH